MNLAALKSPEFRTYIAASFVALNGTWIQRITLGWIAWDSTQSASFVGLISALNFLPAVLSGPFFGVLADRIDLRRAAIAAQIAILVLSALLLGLYLADWLHPSALIVMSLATGMAASAYTPVRMALIIRLAPRSVMSSVVVITSMNFNLSRLSGPAMGGALIASLGVGTALLAVLFAPLPLIMVLYRLKLAAPAGPARVRAAFMADMRAGFAYAADHAVVRRALLITGLAAFTSRGVLEILPAIADGLFNRSAAGLGQLSAAVGAGALASALMQGLGHAAPTQALAIRSIWAALVACGLMIVLGLSTNWPLSLFAVAGMGFCGTLIGVSMQSGIQLSLPDDMRGRVMSLWSLVALGATSAGALVQGALADWLGLLQTMLVIGGAGGVLLLAGLWRDRTK